MGGFWVDHSSDYWYIYSDRVGPESEHFRHERIISRSLLANAIWPKPKFFDFIASLSLSLSLAFISWVPKPSTLLLFSRIADMVLPLLRHAAIARTSSLLRARLLAPAFGFHTRYAWFRLGVISLEISIPLIHLWSLTIVQVTWSIDFFWSSDLRIV